MCLSTLTLKFSTRTPKVPFGPLGGASGIALFTARAPGGLRAAFFFSRGGSRGARGRLWGLLGASGGRPGPPAGDLGDAPGLSWGVLGHLWGVRGASRATCRGPRGRSRAPLGVPGRRWRGFGDLPRSVGSPRRVWSGRGLVSWAGFRCCVLT